MVGVAGKYKGCNSCRLRRVKCDGGRPACKKCINNNRECGYERQATFIIGTLEDQGRCSSHPHRSQVLPKKKPPPVPKFTPTPTPPSSVSSSSPSVSRRTVSWADSPPNAPNNEPHLYHLQFLDLHEQCLVQERFCGIENGNGDTFGTASLMGNIPELAFHSPSLDCSLLALLLLSMPGMTRDPRLEDSMKHITSVTLFKLRLALRDCSGAKTAGSLAAKMCLFLFEYRDSGSVEGWKSLVGETATKVKEMGAPSFRKFPEQQLFSQLFRKAILWQAVGSCQTSFLSLPEWTTVPWEEISKTHMDTLTDQITFLPMLFERGRSLQSTSPSIGRRFKILDFLQNCFRIDTMFQTWHQDLAKRNQSFTYWTMETNPVTDPVFPAKFGFPDFETGVLHIHFWASLSLLYTMVFDTHALLSEPYISNTAGMEYARPTNIQPLQPKYLPGGITIIASNICQSMAYFLKEETFGLGLIAIGPPVYCAQEWFCKRMGGSKEDVWCRGLLTSLSSMGFPMVEEMGNLPWTRF